MEKREIRLPDGRHLIDAVESFRERVSREYARETGRAPLIFRVEAAEGAGEILG